MGSDVAIPPLAGFEGSHTSFHYSFSFLPKAKREALKIIYSFCRTTDDIVDNEKAVSDKIAVLRKWREEFELGVNGFSQYQIVNQLHNVAQKFRIPVSHFYDLLRGVEMDLLKNRYATFEELKEYCYLVASTVGLMSVQIFGPRNEQTKSYAINLGIALQLTNIIRDVGIDAKYGRIYLPQVDLQRFHYSEAELLAYRYNNNFQQLMAFQAERAEEYYKKATDALPAEDRRAMFSAKIMERIYHHTLNKIREERYNVYSGKISIARPIQLLIALKYWVKQRIFGR
jgi:15-cis-phytoene synthase